MFLFMTDEGEILKGDVVTYQDKQASDSGKLDIIDCETMSLFHNGEWYTISQRESD